MRIVVPLAGPDFVREDGSVKAEQAVNGRPILRQTLNTRPWAKTANSSDYVFVMADRVETRAFAAAALKEWYPDAAVVFLSRYTNGAALTALSGVALGSENDGPLIIDLADILYDCDIDPNAVFNAHPDCGGIALCFESDWQGYSYLRLDEEDRFVEAAEKRVISNNASAGTYLFSRASVFLQAVAHALENGEAQKFNGMYYVCPLFNGVRAAGFEVKLHRVSNVVDIKQGG